MGELLGLPLRTTPIMLRLLPYLLPEIERDLGSLVRSYIPVYPSEVVEVDMVAKVSRDMFSWIPDFLDELGV